MSKHKKHPEADENMKIYPDAVPELSRGIMDTQPITDYSPPPGTSGSGHSKKNNLKNNRGWSK